MSTDTFQAVMPTWAARGLPARLDVAQTAKLLGFAEHDIQVLMATRKLSPLGDPAPNAPKWFAAVEILQLAADVDWLNRATKEVSKSWRHKREQRVNPRGAPQRVHRHSPDAVGVVNAGVRVAPAPPTTNPRPRCPTD